MGGGGGVLFFGEIIITIVLIGKKTCVSEHVYYRLVQLLLVDFNYQITPELFHEKTPFFP